jgi:hypothetical protein
MFLRDLLQGKCDGFAFLVLRWYFSSGIDCIFIDELVKVLVELSLVLNAECDVLSPLLKFIYRHDLPTSQQLLDAFSLSVHLLALLRSLQQAGEVTVALLPTSPEMLQLIDQTLLHYFSLSIIDRHDALLRLLVLVLQDGGQVGDGGTVALGLRNNAGFLGVRNLISTAAVVVESCGMRHFLEEDDADAVSLPAPLVHWMMYNSSLAASL